MKKILIALGFTLAAMSSQAALTFQYVGNTIVTNDLNDITGDPAGTVYQYGFLNANIGDVVTFTNASLNSSSGQVNFFYAPDGTTFAEGNNTDTVSWTVLANGPLSFYFLDENNTQFNNGSSSIAVVSTANGFKLLLNDSGNGDDFDDHAVNAVPVPAALPLMASALGAFGIARRRSNKAKAV